MIEESIVRHKENIIEVLRTCKAVKTRSDETFEVLSNFRNETIDKIESNSKEIFRNITEMKNQTEERLSNIDEGVREIYAKVEDTMLVSNKSNDRLIKID
jgi:hypothetical protein